MVPEEVRFETTLFDPVSVIAPPPLTPSVPAVTIPVPLSVAPLETETDAVAAPTLREPERFRVPALTVVMPL